MQDEYLDFFHEMREKIEGMKALVKKHGMEDVFAMAFIGGVYTYNEEGSLKFQAVSDYVVEDEEELDEMLSACLEIYRMTDGMTADEEAKLPRDIKNTDEWTSEDWMDFINKNTEGGKA